MHFLFYYHYFKVHFEIRKVDKTRFVGFYFLQPAFKLVPSPTGFWIGTVCHQAVEIMDHPKNEGPSL